MKSKYIYFTKGTFGNSSGELAKIELETDGEIYFTDGMSRYCYLEKGDPGWRYATSEEIENWKEANDGL